MGAAFRRRRGGRREADLSATRAVAPAVAIVLSVVTTLGTIVQLTSPQRLLAVGYLGPLWLPAVNLTATMCVLTTAVASRARARGPMGGLTLMLAALLMPSWAEWPAIPATVAVALLASSPLLVAGVALVARVRRARWALALTGVACAVLALAYNPFADPACWESCSDVARPLTAWLPTSASITVAALLELAAIGMIGMALVGGRAMTSGAVVAGSAAALAVLAAAATLRLLGWLDRSTLLAERLLPSVAIIVLTAAAILDEVQLARTRLAMERLVAGLAASGSQLVTLGAGVRSVLFAVGESDAWVDESGRPAPAPDGRCLTLSDASGPTVMLSLAGQAEEAGLLAALTPGARLALRNAQLTAVGKARLAEVQASARRIVTTSDAERRRIERDLHDGAQQRLVSVALHLQVALARVPPPATEVLREAETQVRQALARLRGLAHGLAPAVLAEEGLAAALADLAAGSELAMVLDLQIRGVLDPDAGMAAYCAVSAAVTAAPAESTVEVRAGHDERQLTVRLIVPGATSAEVKAAMGDAEDRVAALGGSLAVHPGGLGTEVTAVIPCESS